VIQTDNEKETIVLAGAGSLSRSVGSPFFDGVQCSLGTVILALISVFSSNEK